MWVGFRCSFWLLVTMSGCSGILGIPEPQLTTGGTPDAAPISHPDARIPDAAIKLTLTINKESSGAGSVVADFAANTCAADCPTLSFDVPQGTSVNLEARPAAGSFFEGWVGACTGTYRFCSVTLDQAKTVFARFTATTNNIMFVTNQRMSGNFGGLAAADTLCNQAATNAGLSGTFMALLSTTGTNVKDRLVVPGGGSPRGWIRPDGKPVVDSLADLFTTHRVWYPPIIDENGKVTGATNIWTGSDPSGMAVAANCSGWTSNTSDQMAAQWGDIDQGPFISSAFTWKCDDQNPLLCLQVDKADPLGPPAKQQGKVIFVSKVYFAPGAGGLLAANNICANEKPASVATAKALLATTSAAASSLVQPDTLYVRPDGLAVGTGADFAAGRLQTGIWQHGDGSYTDVNWGMWHGSMSFDAPAANGSENCTNWASSSGSMSAIDGTPGIWNWWVGCCSTMCNQQPGMQIFCVEQ